MNEYNGLSPCWQTAPEHFASDLQMACRDFYDRAEITGSVDYMREHEIDACYVEAHAGVLGVCGLRFFAGQRFEFDDGPEAVPSAVVEALDRDGETVIDLVAWPLAAPWHSRACSRGRACLGCGWPLIPPPTFSTCR